MSRSLLALLLLAALGCSPAGESGPPGNDRTAAVSVQDATASARHAGPQLTPTDAAPEPAPDAQPTPSACGIDLAPSEPFGLTEVRLTDGATNVCVPAYVAATQDLRQRGLMGRTDLPDGTGMIFLFDELRTGGFWMKDTLIPLSIAFADVEGTVVAVLDMEPCQADPCPVYDPGVAYTTALEVNQGFFSEIGMEEGWTVMLPARP